MCSVFFLLFAFFASRSESTKRKNTVATRLPLHSSAAPEAHLPWRDLVIVLLRVFSSTGDDWDMHRREPGLVQWQQTATRTIGGGGGVKKKKKSACTLRLTNLTFNFVPFTDACERAAIGGWGVQLMAVVIACPGTFTLRHPILFEARLHNGMRGDHDIFASLSQVSTTSLHDRGLAGVPPYFSRHIPFKLNLQNQFLPFLPLLDHFFIAEYVVCPSPSIT